MLKKIILSAYYAYLYARTHTFGIVNFLKEIRHSFSLRLLRLQTLSLSFSHTFFPNEQKERVNETASKSKQAEEKELHLSE